MSRRTKSPPLLSKDDERNIRLWFAWGNILGYATGPRAYLREVLKPERRVEFLAMPRPKRKAILQFVIAEGLRRPY